jgi:hypothetical protein
VSLGYSDFDDQFVQSDTPPSGELPDELRGETVVHTEDAVDSDPKSGSEPSQHDGEPRAPKKLKLSIKKSGQAVASQPADKAAATEKTRAGKQLSFSTAHSTKQSSSNGSQSESEASDSDLSLGATLKKFGCSPVSVLLKSGNGRVLCVRAEQVAELTKELRTAQNELRAAKWSIKAATGDKERYRKQRNQLQERVDLLEAQLASMDSLTDDKDEIIKVLREEIEDLKAQLSEAEAKEAEVAGKKRKLEVDPKHCGKPLHFDGKSPNVRDWLMNLELYFELMADSIPAECQVGTAATYLKGEALRYWHFRLKQLDEFQKSDMSVFQRSLIERFDSANDPIAARYKLDKLQQGDNAMRVHVQTFDTLCSYIPDMADGEKIHRFLTTVRAECSKVLCNDPSTGARWDKYADMRRYALNQYAHEKNFRSATPHTGMLDALVQKFKGHPSKRGTHQHSLQKRTSERQKHDGSGKHRRAGKGAEPRLYTFHDRFGKAVVRPSGVKNFCFEKKLCGICYSSEHFASQCERRLMVEGNPPDMP